MSVEPLRFADASDVGRHLEDSAALWPWLGFVARLDIRDGAWFAPEAVT